MVWRDGPNSPVQVVNGLEVGECEKEGDGLHWLWEMAEEVGLGW